MEEIHLFNVGFFELLVILFIAFVVVGPEDLPKVARWLGKLIRNLRLLFREFKEQMGIDELEREIDRDIRRLKKDSDLSHEVSLNTKSLNRELNEINQTLKEE